MPQHALNGDPDDDRDSVDGFLSPLHLRFLELERRWNAIKQTPSPFSRWKRQQSASLQIIGSRRHVSPIQEEASPSSKISKDTTESSLLAEAGWTTESSLLNIQTESLSTENHDSSHSSLLLEDSVSTPRGTWNETPRPSATSGRRTSEAVFDRLYEQGKAQIAASRIREQYNAQDSQSVSSIPMSVGGTSVSALSTESVFERLYNKKKRSGTMPKSVSRLLGTPSPEATTSLERRLSYAQSVDRKRSSLIRHHSNPELRCPSDETSDISLGERSVASVRSGSSRDSIFERLYRRKKRPETSLLPAGYHIFPSTTPIIKTESSKEVNTPDALPTPKRRGGRQESQEQEYDEQLVNMGDDSSTGFASCISHISVVHQSPNNVLHSPYGSSATNLSEFLVNEGLKVEDSLLECFNSESEIQSISAPPLHNKMHQDIPDGAESRSAVTIQKTWRMHRAEVALADKLLVGWWMKCDYQSSAYFNKVLVLKMGLDSLSKASQNASGSVRPSNVDKKEKGLLFGWNKEVVVEIDVNGVSMMECVTVRLTCSTRRSSVSLHWSSGKTASLVVRATLERVKNLDEFLNACATIIQRWVRANATKKRWRARRLQLLQAPSKLCELFLNPTSRQNQSAILIQSIYRGHQANVRIASMLLNSWWLKYNLATSSIARNSKILGMKIGLLGTMRAISQVDCWWVADDMETHKDTIIFDWQREVGVHFNHQGAHLLELCIVRLRCEAKRSLLCDRWDRRKQAITFIKAALYRLLKEAEEEILVTGVTMVQSWWRMLIRRISFLECMRMKERKILYATCIQTFWRQWIQQDRYLTIQASVLLIQRCTRGWQVRCLQDKRFEAARIIQIGWRNYIYESAFDTIQVSICGIQSCFFRLRATKRIRDEVVYLPAPENGSKSPQVSNKREKGAIIIQRQWRTSFNKMILSKQISAATKLQCLVRKRISADALKKKMSNVHVIQTAARLYLKQIHISKRFNSIKAIQRWWRRGCVRRKFVANVKVQRWCRMILARRIFREQRLSCICIQNWWRAKRQLRNYTRLVVATIALQSAIRSRSQQQGYFGLRLATITVQAFARGCSTRSQIKMVKEEKHSMVTTAAVIIQTRARIMFVRQSFLLRRSAVIAIQTHWRRFIQQRKFADLRAAVKRAVIAVESIQGWWKRTIATRKVVAIVKVQSWSRMILVRRMFREQHVSCICVQKWWRGRRQLRSYTRLVVGTIALQSAVRTQFQKQGFCRLREAAISVQAFARGCSTREQVKMAKERKDSMVMAAVAVVMAAAAVIVQTRTRVVLARRSFLLHRSAVIAIQTHWRRFIQQRKYAHLLAALIRALAEREAIAVESIQGWWRRRLAWTKLVAVVKVQRWSRMILVRRMFREQQVSCICIQKWWRGRRQLRNYARLIVGTIALQSVVRSRMQQEGYFGLRLATITVQAFARGCSTRSQIRMMKGTKHSLAVFGAATILQKRVRAVLARQLYLRRLTVVIAVQTHWRRFIQQRKFADLLAALKRALAEREAIAVESIQDWWRRRLAWTKLVAVVKMQRWCRMILVRRMFREQQVSCIFIQKWWRGRRQLRSYARLIVATIALQSAIRSRIQQEEYSRLRQAVITAQSVARGYSSRLQIKKSKEENCLVVVVIAATIIQTRARIMFARRSFLLHRNAVIAIQTHWRRFIQQRKFADLLAALIRALAEREAIAVESIQGWWRRRLAWTKLVAVVKVQRWSRMILVRRMFREQHVSCICVQKWWRGRRQLRSYTRLVVGTIALQSAVRTQFQKQGFCRLREAAISVQAFARGCSTREQVKMAKERKDSMVMAAVAVVMAAAAVIVQTRTRVVLARRSFLLHRSAVIAIQTHWRRFIQQRKYAHLLAALIRALAEREAIAVESIQGWWRRRLAWTKLVAVVKVQRWSRMILVRRMFREQQVSCICIQKWWRGRRQLRNYARLIVGTIALQSVVRSRMQQEGYFGLRLATITVQAFARGCSTRSQIRMMKGTKHSLAVFGAATILQKRVRAVLARQLYLRRLTAVIAVQTHWRRFIQKRKYADLRAALKRALISVERIQGWWKRAIAMRKVAAVVKVQRWCRMILVRRMFREQQVSCIFIQKWWRGRRQLRSYARLIVATIALQSAIRSRIQQEAYSRLRQAVITAQSVARGYSSRLQIKKSKEENCLVVVVIAATIIQTRARIMFARRSFLFHRNAVIAIQTHWRRFIQQRKFADLLAAVRRALAEHKAIAVESIQGWWRRRLAWTKLVAVVKVQRWSRMILVRRMFREQQVSCICIQKWWRGRRQLRSYTRLVVGTIALQSVVRSRMQQEEYSRLRQAVITAQAWARGCLTRKQIKMVRGEKHSVETAAAVIIQTRARILFARQAYLLRRSAVIAIQTHWRRFIQQRKFADLLAAVRRALAEHKAIAVESIQGWWRRRLAWTKLVAVVKVQRWSRMILVRRMFREQQVSCICIQKWWRGRRQLRNYARLVVGTIALQSVVRSRMRQEEYSRLRQAVITAQSVARGCLTRKQIKMVREEKHSMVTAAAVIIQTRARIMFARRSYLLRRSAVIAVQTHWRRFIQQRKFADLLAAVRRALAEREAIAVESIQGWWRRRLAWTKLVAVVKVQRWCRMILVRRMFREHLVSCIFVQKWWRGRRQLRSYARLVVGTIALQSVVRTRSQRERYFRLLQAAIIAQAWVRGCSTRSRIKIANGKNYLCLGAAVILQTRVRGLLARQSYLRYYAAVIAIQKHWKRYANRCAHLLLKDSAVVIQQSWLRAIHHRRFTQKRTAAIIVQAVFRGSITRNQIGGIADRKRLKAALMLQSWTRKNTAQNLLLKQRKAVLTTQRAWKEYLYRKRLVFAVIFIQANLRRRLAQQRFLELRKAIIHLQALIRGYCERKETYLPLANWRAETRQKLLRNLAITRFQGAVRSFQLSRLFTLKRNAAKIIQRSYFRWKMTMTLLTVQSSIVLLKRSVRGQISRSATRFALSHFNSSISGFDRIYDGAGRILDSESLIAWSKATAMARDASAIVIQSAIRRFLAVEKARKMIEPIKSGVGSALQAFFGVQLQDGVVTSTPYRALFTRKPSRISTRAAVRIQAAWRRCSAYRFYVIKQHFVVLVQSRARMYIAVGIVRSKRKERLLAIITLQRIFRGISKLKSFQRWKQATVIIQTHTRFWLAKSSLHHLRHNSMRNIDKIKIIQRICRRHIREKMVERRRSAAIVLQKTLRRHAGILAYSATLCSVLRLQATFRMWLTTSKIHATHGRIVDEAAGNIQAWIRGHKFRRQFLQHVSAAILLQGVWRRGLEVRRYTAFKVAVLRIQGVFRMWLAQSRARSARLLAENRAAIVLQVWTRNCSVRSKHQRRIRGIHVVQSFFRRASWKKRQNFLHTSAFRIQNWYRTTNQRNLDRLDHAKAIDDVRAVLEESIMSEMERRARNQVERLLSSQSSVRNTSASVRRLARRVKKLSVEIK